MIDDNRFNVLVTNLLNEIEKTQNEVIKEAGKVISEAIENGGVLHAFSTGHSHMVVEEMFYRAGGLMPVNPILDPALMLHEGAFKSTKIERLSGYASVIFESVKFQKGEPILIISNSGINPVPVEMALLSKQNGQRVIAITSVTLSRSLQSRHDSGKKLMDIADYVIDNCIKDGDASIEIEEYGQRVGAVSSIVGIYIAQKLVISVVNEFLKKGKKPPIFMSANVPGGDEHNAYYINKYSERIRGLY
ncbi:MAG TPA: SIS domain-containing protein [Clostridiaceae bacterium]|nr:SIS domain-containing protein [Clostridiaceae bacterium]